MLPLVHTPWTLVQIHMPWPPSEKLKRKLPFWGRGVGKKPMKFHYDPMDSTDPPGLWPGVGSPTDTNLSDKSLHEMFTGNRDTDAVFAAWFYLKDIESGHRGYMWTWWNLAILFVANWWFSVQPSVFSHSVVSNCNFAAPENCSLDKASHSKITQVTKQTHKPAKAASSCSKILGINIPQLDATWGEHVWQDLGLMQSLDFQLLSQPSSRSYSTLGNSAHLRCCGRFVTALSFMGDFEGKTW